MRLVRLIPAVLLMGLLLYNMQTMARVWTRVTGSITSVIVAWEMSGIKKSLVAVVEGGARLPEQGPEFDKFLRDSFPPSKRDVTRDRFGNKYVLAPLRSSDNNKVRGFRLTSPGADHKVGTADDIVVEYRSE